MLLLRLPNGQLRQVEEGSCLLPIAAAFAERYTSPVIEGVFNGEAVDLQKPLTENGSVDFIEINSTEGMRVYTRTLLFMMLRAVKELRPDVDLEVRNTLGSALYCLDKSSRKLTQEDIAKISEYMQRLVAEKTPITLQRLTKAEAMALAAGICSEDSLALLEQVPEDAVLTINFLKGEPGYFFGALAPDCSYVPRFELLSYADGVIIN